MSRIFLVLALAGLLALAVSQAHNAASSSSVTVTVDANPDYPGVQVDRLVTPGSAFYVDVLIGSVSDLQAFNFELVYDQTVVSAPTITTGPDTDRNPDAEQTFLSSTGRTWSCSPPAPSGDIDPDPNVGAARLSCFSTGSVPGPDVGATETLLATAEFEALAEGSTALTLRNVNTFREGGIETGSCNPVVVTAAICTDSGATVGLPVGGIAQLPDLHDSGGSSVRHLIALGGIAAVGLVALGAGTWYARRRWSA
jgi:hypothetical protein